MYIQYTWPLTTPVNILQWTELEWWCFPISPVHFPTLSILYNSCVDTNKEPHAAMPPLICNHSVGSDIKLDGLVYNFVKHILENIDALYVITSISIYPSPSWHSMPVVQSTNTKIGHILVDGVQSQWLKSTFLIFWADHVTICQRMGCSPYFAVTGTHPWHRWSHLSCATADKYVVNNWSQCLACYCLAETKIAPFHTAFQSHGCLYSGSDLLQMRTLSDCLWFQL